MKSLLVAYAWVLSEVGVSHISSQEYVAPPGPNWVGTGLVYGHISHKPRPISTLQLLGRGLRTPRWHPKWAQTKRFRQFAAAEGATNWHCDNRSPAAERVPRALAENGWGGSRSLPPSPTIRLPEFFESAPVMRLAQRGAGRCRHIAGGIGADHARLICVEIADPGHAGSNRRCRDCVAVDVAGAVGGTSRKRERISALDAGLQHVIDQFRGGRSRRRTGAFSTQVAHRGGKSAVAGRERDARRVQGSQRSHSRRLIR